MLTALAMPQGSDFQYPCCAAGLQANKMDNNAVTTAKLTAAAILIMVLSNQVTTG